jgi:predicted nucleic acid-binding protein
MRLVVADTSPLRYLLQIDQIGLLPRLFEKVLIPSVVRDELTHPSAPEAVRNWMTSPPGWIEVSVVSTSADPSLSALDEGERAAIALGLSLEAELILMDDRRGAAVARVKGFSVAGTLGILDLAARRNMVDLADVLARMGSRGSGPQISAGGASFSMSCSGSMSDVAASEGSGRPIPESFPAPLLEEYWAGKP